MNIKNDGVQIQTPKEPLKFVIEGKEYKTYEQYITGAELKHLADIPLETELFLSISKPYNYELIENDTRINLARPETEYFFVKKKLHFTINGVPFIWYKQYIRGIQIRELGNISLNDELYLDLPGDWNDDFIENDEIIDLARPGVEHFISKSKPKEYKIIVNAREKLWNQHSISFEQIIELAFGSYDNNPNRGYTVTYCKGPKPNNEGIMVKGSVVDIKNNMIFDVTATDKS